jgi:hypothetical protein
VIGDEFITVTSKEWAKELQANGANKSGRTARMLEEHIDLQFEEPTTLGKAIEVLESRTRRMGYNVPIFFNLTEGESKSITFTYRSNFSPLRESLKEMLAKVGLEYDASAGQITIFDPRKGGPGPATSVPGSAMGGGGMM